jgi:predicted porin
MKKLLVAAAIASSFAIPATAQNVTLYGAVDAGIESYDNNVKSMTRNTNGRHTTTRFGFRSSEDIGGGMKAEFNLQSATGMDNTTPAGIAFNEEFWVGLSGSFGAFRIGTTDMTQAEGVDSFVANGAGNFANWMTLQHADANAGGSPAIAAGARNGELGGNMTNTIRYYLPAMGGLSAQVAYSSGNANATIVDADGEAWGASATYTAGDLGLIGGYQVQKTRAGGVQDRDSRAIGLRYNLGSAQIGLAHLRADSSVATNSLDLKASTANIAVPLGAGLTVHALYSSVKRGGEDKGNGIAALLRKELSKRTSIYGAYVAVNSGADGQAAWAGSTITGTNGVDVKGVTVGLAHTF